jgi:hypothetical protein
MDKCVSCGTNTYMEWAVERKCLCCGVKAVVCGFCGNNKLPVYWQRVPPAVYFNGIRNPIGMSEQFVTGRVQYFPI